MNKVERIKTVKFDYSFIHSSSCISFNSNTLKVTNRTTTILNEEVSKRSWPEHRRPAPPYVIHVKVKYTTKK